MLSFYLSLGILVTYAVLGLYHPRTIPPTAMPFRDNDHTHARAHLASACESALQNFNLALAAAILSSMGSM